MNYGNEMRMGYICSFLSPLIVSGAVAVWTALETGFGDGIGNFFGAFFGSYFLFGLFSLLYMAVFCAVIGLPTYYVLRKLNWANPVVITAIGGVAAYLYALTDTSNPYFRGLFVTYGAVGAFFFWLGSDRVRKRL